MERRFGACATGSTVGSLRAIGPRRTSRPNRPFCQSTLWYHSNRDNPKVLFSFASPVADQPSRRFARIAKPLAPMVNRPLTSPPLSSRHAASPQARIRFHEPRRPRSVSANRARARRALAVRAPDRIARRRRARPAADQPVGRRAAASDPAVRRPGLAGAPRRFRPLSAQPRHAALSRGRGRLDQPPL